MPRSEQRITKSPQNILRNSSLRKELHRLDFLDLRQKQPALTKLEFKERVRQTLRTAKAQRVARQCVVGKKDGLRAVCQQVVNREGAASDA